MASSLGRGESVSVRRNPFWFAGYFTHLLSKRTIENGIQCPWSVCNLFDKARLLSEAIIMSKVGY